MLTAKALAQTYSNDNSDPWDRVEGYQRYLDYSAKHPNKGSHAVARALDMPRSRVRVWIENGSKPDPMHAVETADLRGWLNATTADATGRALNILVAASLSGGSIDTKRFQPTFTVDRAPVEQRVVDALETLDVGVKRIDRNASNRASEVTAAEDRTVLGRVLVALGVPQGDKNEQSVSTLPAYLETATPVAKAEFVELYLLNRGTALDEKDGLLISERRSKAYRRELAKLFEDGSGESVSVYNDAVYVSSEAARALGFGRGTVLRDALDVKRGTRTP